MIDLGLEDLKIASTESLGPEMSPVKTVPDIKLIREFELKNKVQFPNSYLALVVRNDGTTFKSGTFDSNGEKEQMIEKLLSWDQKSKNNFIIKTNKEIDSATLKDKRDALIFAADPWGDKFLFIWDKSTDEPSIVRWAHESDERVLIANTFDAFLGMLYSG